MVDDLPTWIDELQHPATGGQTHFEPLSITRKTVTGLADRLPATPPDLPERPDYPRILAVFNDTTGPLRARDVCEALDHELLAKNVEGTRAKLNACWASSPRPMPAASPGSDSRPGVHPAAPVGGSREAAANERPGRPLDGGASGILRAIDTSWHCHARLK
ncbi:hypothetical protein [Streptomyces flavidovirens]|uniref:hypothetical protein n=1 Tax=Streptomyces flavidovirens TaxID=67298 RepID=UPI0036836C9F